MYLTANSTTQTLTIDSNVDVSVSNRSGGAIYCGNASITGGGSLTLGAPGGLNGSGVMVRGTNTTISFSELRHLSISGTGGTSSASNGITCGTSIATAAIKSGSVTDTKTFVLTVISSDSVNLSGVYLTNATQPNVPHIDIGDTITVVAYGQPGATVKADVTYKDVLDSDTEKTLPALALTEDAGTGVYQGAFTIADGMMITGVKATMTTAGKNPSDFNMPEEKIPETRGSLNISIANGAGAEGLLTAYSASLSAGSSVKVYNNTIKGLMPANDYRLSMAASDGFDMGSDNDISVVAGKANDINFTAIIPTTLSICLTDSATGAPLVGESVTIRNAATGQILANKYTDTSGYLPMLGSAYSFAPVQNIELVYKTYLKMFSIGGTMVQREYPAQTIQTHMLTAGVNTGRYYQNQV